MPNLTDRSDVNELYITFLLSGETWGTQDLKEIFEKKYLLVGAEESELQIERARFMVTAFISWAENVGYKLPIKSAWWTGRPGTLQSVFQKDIDQRKNTTDVLAQFSDGPARGYLGMSAKSTRGKCDIGFKNLGIGSVETDLKIEISSVVNQISDPTIKELCLPEQMEERKIFIRENPHVRKITRQIGTQVLEKMRDILFDRLKEFHDDHLRYYILDTWLNATLDKYPPYIKVTGLGDRLGHIWARVEHPLDNDKVRSLTEGDIYIERYGWASVGVSGSGKKVMKIRAKYSSEKLASSLKYMGDPW